VTASDNDLIIEQVIDREGRGKVTNRASDPGGLTYEGISQRANPDLFVNGLPTEAQVRQRYLDRYVVGPGFDRVPDLKVRALLVDWGVNSGPMIAIAALQRVVGVPADGVLGPATLEAAAQRPPEELVKKLVAERVKMIGRLVQQRPSQIGDLSGWLNRALEFL
jgi:lysozyme family protein